MRSREKKERRVSVERKKIDERREAKNFGFKNKKFKKEDTTLLSSVGGGGVSSLLLARTLCAVNIHSTRILTVQRREHFQREKEKRVRK